MVPVGAGSLEGATQAFAVGVGVEMPAVAVPWGVALGDALGVDPHAVAMRTMPANAARRRIPLSRSADSGGLLLVRVGNGDDVEMLTTPGIDGIDHPLQVD